MTKKTTVAFTGRRDGLTEEQKNGLREFLFTLGSRHYVFVHNDGEGSDQVFKNLCTELGHEVAENHIDSDVGAMARNRSLVRSCTLLLATPPTDDILKKGSGTWETIKYGWKYGKKVGVFQSDGRLVLCLSKKEYLETLV